MGKNTRPSLTRLQELGRRQGTFRWGSEYRAAIKATREEAPSASWVGPVPAPRFGRELQAISSVERDVFTMVANDPSVVEALDQYVLPTHPSQNWLIQSPYKRVTGAGTMVRGTVSIADELGALSILPTVRHPELGHLPFPWIGDLLVFVRTAEGEVKTINLTIKDSAEDFERPYRAGRRARDPGAVRERERLRHRIEEVLHSEAGTPTVRVTKADYSEIYARNMRWAHDTARTVVPMTDRERQLVEAEFATCAVKGRAPFEAIRNLRTSHGIARETSRPAFCAALLARRIPVDLTSDVIVEDKPLRYLSVEKQQGPQWLRT